MSRAQWSAEQCRLLTTPQSRYLRRAPAVGLLGALLARAVPDKPTTTTSAKLAQPTTPTEGGAQ